MSDGPIKHAEWCIRDICTCAAQGSSVAESMVRQHMNRKDCPDWEREAWLTVIRDRQHSERVMEQVLSALPADSDARWWIECAIASMRRFWQDEPRTAAPAHMERRHDS